MNNGENTKKRLVKMSVGSNYVVVTGQFCRVVMSKSITMCYEHASVKLRIQTIDGRPLIGASAWPCERDRK